MVVSLLKQLPELDIDVLLLDVHLPDIEEEDLLETDPRHQTRPESALSHTHERHYATSTNW